MMLTVNAYAATSPTEPLVPTTITRRTSDPNDVLIEIAYAGVCHSDIHTVRGDWGPITYPQVVGHEIAGTVDRGRLGRHQARGRRPGRASAASSTPAASARTACAGEEQYCLNGNIGTYGCVDRDGTITQGGYSTHVVVDEDFVLRIPESLDFEQRRAAAVRRDHHLLPAAALAGRAGHEGGRGRHGRPRPPRRQARPRHGRRGDRAVADPVEAATTVCGSAPTPTTRPATRHTFDRAREQLRPDHQHRLAPIDLNAYLRLLRRDGTLVSVGAPPSRCRSRVFSLFGNRRSLRRLLHRRHPPRPRRCSTSAPSTASNPRSS